eukprot:2590897-Rhodomonas_salina.1
MSASDTARARGELALGAGPGLHPQSPRSSRAARALSPAPCAPQQLPQHAAPTRVSIVVVIIVVGGGVDIMSMVSVHHHHPDRSRSHPLLHGHHPGPRPHSTALSLPRAQHSTRQHSTDQARAFEFTLQLSLGRKLVALAIHLDAPAVSREPRSELRGRLLLQQRRNGVDDIERVILRDVRGPTRANADGAVDEQHRDDGEVRRRFHQQPVLLLAREQGVVGFGEQQPRVVVQQREDVSRARGVLPSFQPRAELPDPVQQRQVIRPWIVVRHPHDRVVQRGLPVVVSSLLRHVPAELRDLQAKTRASGQSKRSDRRALWVRASGAEGEPALEAREEDLAARGLQPAISGVSASKNSSSPGENGCVATENGGLPVEDGRDAALDARERKLDQLLVHKVVVGELGLRVVDVVRRVRSGSEQPLLALVGLLLGEDELERFVVGVALPDHVQRVPRQVRKVLLALLRRVGAQPFVAVSYTHLRAHETEADL